MKTNDTALTQLKDVRSSRPQMMHSCMTFFKLRWSLNSFLQMLQLVFFFGGFFFFPPCSFHSCSKWVNWITRNVDWLESEGECRGSFFFLSLSNHENKKKLFLWGKRKRQEIIWKTTLNSHLSLSIVDESQKKIYFYEKWENDCKTVLYFDIHR